MTQYQIAFEFESGVVAEAVKQQLEQTLPDAENVQVEESGRFVHVDDHQVAGVGVPFPPIEGCPECGYEAFDVIAINRDEEAITVDGRGGIADFKQRTVIDATYSMIECGDCGEVLVEDGEIVHEDL